MHGSTRRQPHEVSLFSHSFCWQGRLRLKHSSNLPIGDRSRAPRSHYLFALGPTCRPLPQRVLRFRRHVLIWPDYSASLHTQEAALPRLFALMLRPSRRDQLALEPLLPLIDREITADPEQRDPSRRAARREGVVQATSYFRNLRNEDEERKDRELRAKLDGVSKLLTCRQVTNIPRSGVATSSRIPPHGGKRPTVRLAAGAEANTRRSHSGHSEERHRAIPHRTPLTHITSMSFERCLLRFSANVSGQILPPSIQQVLNLG